MRMQLKNIIALTLLGAVAASGAAVYAADYGDDVPSRIELYMKRLNTLGIMSETEDMSKTLTRGEMSKILCGVGGYEVDSSQDKIFTDVPRDYIYADYINTAYNYGIINGKGNGIFAPDEEVTREQMYKMLLCAAGYQSFAEQDGGYPTGYITLAGKTGMVMSGAKGTVTVSEAAYTVFKALEMPVVRANTNYVKFGETDDSLLNMLLDNNDMEIYDGILTFDGYTDLTGTELPDSHFAGVDGERLYNAGTQLGGLIGRHIEYITKDDEMIAAYEYPGKNSTVSFSAEDIDSVDDLNSYRVITENNKKETYRLSDAPYVVYNMQGVSSHSDEYLKPKYGSVTLIDNNYDRKYDVVMVSDRKYYVVDDASTNGLSVQYKKYAGQSENGYYISDTELNDSIYYNVTDGDGKSLDSSAVCKNAVVGVSKSVDGLMMNVVVTKNMIEGKLDTINSDELVINGATYEILADARGNTPQFEVRVGDTVSAYLNENGRVVYCESQSSGDGNYAYISGVFYDQGPDKTYIRIVKCGNLGSLENRKYWWVKDKMAQNDSIVTYELGDKVRINGEKQTDDNVNGLLHEVVLLKMNNSGQLTGIDVLTPEFEYTSGKYNHNTGAMVQKNLEDEQKLDYDNPAALLSGNIKTLVVPKTNDREYSEDEYMAKYRIENGESNHEVAFYDIPEGSQTPHLLVLRAALSEAGTAQSDASVGIITSNLRKGIDEDGEDFYTVDMYGTDGGTRQVIIRGDAERTDSSVKANITDLAKGDVVEFSWDSRGRAMTVHIIASSSEPVERMQMGTVEKIQKNVIWNKTDGDEFYNVFFYVDGGGNRVEAGVKAEYPIFRFKDNIVEKIETADIAVDPDGINGDTVVIAGKIAVILPLD
ncbi:MAG: S-layer homology domain-containing protein [bacterium]|nr:S-layer homology domain-containing protein [bacterium]